MTFDFYSHLMMSSFLKGVTLFEKCPPQKLHDLSLHVRQRVYRKGDSILFQGVIAHQLYIIFSGSVIVLPRKDMSHQKKIKLGRGDFLGAISLVKNCSSTATVKIAEDQTEICQIDHDVIAQLMKEHPDFKADLTHKVMNLNRYQWEFVKKQAGAALS